MRHNFDRLVVILMLTTKRSTMKTQQNLKSSPKGQGRPTSDRSFTDHKEDMKQKGISNGGGQRSDQTSNRDNERKWANKK
ncbi:MAG: hypothetical protein JWP78_707 [Mucilaginibacter sp.]|nr:hypothetical protein [Mucilaginibacter sp.]